jgi:hypothetical protein
VTAQGFDARFSAQAAAFLRALVEAATQQVFHAETLVPLLSRFQGVYLTDCTRIEATVLPLKVAARLELQGGSLHLSLEDLQTHDNACAVAQHPLPAGALHLGDLGFFDLERFAHWQANQVEWVSRYKTGTTVYDAAGKRLSLETLLPQSAATLVMPVQVGQQRLPMYLLAQRVEEIHHQQRLQRLQQRARRKQRPLSSRQRCLARWTLYLTSLPDLTFAQVHTLYRARWQIERLFKRWKSLALLTTSTSRDPHRRACEVYAKLLAVLVAQWLTQAFAQTATPLSHDKLFQALQHHATWFYLAYFRFPALLDPLAVLFHLLLPATTLSRRKQRPNAVDLWLRFDGLA